MTALLYARGGPLKSAVPRIWRLRRWAKVCRDPRRLAPEIVVGELVPLLPHGLFGCGTTLAGLSDMILRVKRLEAETE